jgi:uncharacterized coiled-coil DUF342 family protein
MEDLLKEIQIIKQIQDDINGYLNSLTTDIDQLKTNFDELNAKLSEIGSQDNTLEKINLIQKDIALIFNKLGLEEGPSSDSDNG